MPVTNYTLTPDIIIRLTDTDGSYFIEYIQNDTIISHITMEPGLRENTLMVELNSCLVTFDNNQFKIRYNEQDVILLEI
jgi:hypothetical protein